MLTKETILAILKEQYPYLASEYGITRLGIFGSFAQGTATDDSDIDLLAEFNRPVGFKFIELAEYLEQLLGRKADVLTPAGLNGVRNKRIAQSIRETLEYVQP